MNERDRRADPTRIARSAPGPRSFVSKPRLTDAPTVLHRAIGKDGGHALEVHLTERVGPTALQSTNCRGVTTKSSGRRMPVAWFGQ